MSVRYRNVTIRLVPDDTSSVDKSLVDKTVFLQCAFKLNLARVTGEAAAEMVLDESLGHLWSDVPSLEGKYIFEIATEIPYYLPSVNGKSEYVIQINNVDFYICLRMVRAFYGAGFPHDDGLDYFLAHRNALQQLGEDGAQLHPIPIKTFVSRKFDAIAQTAEEALQDNFKVWRDQFVAEVSYLIEAVRASSPDNAKHLLPQQSISSFPIFWVAVVGEGEMGCEQFVGDAGTAALRSVYQLNENSLSKLSEFLREHKSIPIHEAALSQARTFAHYNLLGLAIVQICVACEALLSQKFIQYLTKVGASNTQINDNIKEVTFSQLVNLHLYTICNIQSLSNYQEIIGDINWARRQRNEIVHKGSVPQSVSSREVEKTIKSTSLLIEFIVNSVS